MDVTPLAPHKEGRERVELVGGPLHGHAWPVKKGAESIEVPVVTVGAGLKRVRYEVVRGPDGRAVAARHAPSTGANT